MSRMLVWCECGHQDVWHFESGPCGHRWDDAHALAGQDCECPKFRPKSVYVA